MLVYYVHLIAWHIVDNVLRELWVLTNSKTLFNAYIRFDQYKPDRAWYTKQGA